MNIALITPAARGSRSGNRSTAERWARFLRQLGHRVVVQETWDGKRSDLMITLHARHSHRSIKGYAASYPECPLIVVLTGTDLYRDIRADEEARESLELATHLVVLQEAGLAELEPRHRAKARVIYQSAEPIELRPPAKRHFDVCVAGHLREEKDPFRAALAARLLLPTSRVRILHAGKALSEELAERARDLMAAGPRYRWLGEVPRWRARRLMAHSRLLVQSSIMEGGANTISEALAAGVPVVASDVPGNVGMLGEDYPGYYPVGDEHALARVLHRAETDAVFYESLRSRCADRHYLVLPERERQALDTLVKEAVRPKAVRRKNGTREYNGGMDERTRIRLTKYSTKAG